MLLIGKSINFLHQVCHDRTPPGKIMPASKSTDSPKDGELALMQSLKIAAFMLANAIFVAIMAVNS